MHDCYMAVMLLSLGMYQQACLPMAPVLTLSLLQTCSRVCNRSTRLVILGRRVPDGSGTRNSDRRDRLEMTDDRDSTAAALMLLAAEAPPTPQRSTQGGGASPSPARRNQVWTGAEDTRLRQLVEQYGARDWPNIARLLGGDRNAKQCGDR